MHLRKSIHSISVAAITSLVFGLAGFWAATEFFIKFKSDGILTIDMSGAEYKRFTEAASSFSSLKQVFASIPPDNEDDKVAIEKMLVLDVQKWHTPMPVLSKIDTRDLPEALVKMELDRSIDKTLERSTDKTKPLNIYVGAKLLLLAMMRPSLHALRHGLVATLKRLQLKRLCVISCLFGWLKIGSLTSELRKISLNMLLKLNRRRHGQPRSKK